MSLGPRDVVYAVPTSDNFEKESKQSNEDSREHPHSSYSGVRSGLDPVFIEGLKYRRQ